MAIECPYCRHVLTGQLSTHGLPFHRCTACARFFPAPNAAAKRLTIPADFDSATHREVVSPIVAGPPPVKPTDTDLPPRRPGQRMPPPGLALPTVPGFHVERVLGRGGMGTVYLARQLSLDRPVALKVMSRRWAGDPVFVARFTREAFAAARLNHPNLVQVHDIGEANGAKYFSMEYVPGRTLSDAMRAEGKLDPETAVGYVLQAARGLQHAHERGMIHRDIKPDNILVDPNGMVKVADLGLVKTGDMAGQGDPAADTWDGFAALAALKGMPAGVTGARMALGTPAYMSPEQCRDAAAVDHRADIYSLGCTLYVLLTGKPPFDGDTAVELMTKHAYQPLVPPEEIAARVPKGLSAVIQRMMAKDANERYQSMEEVVRVLEQWLGVSHTTRVTARDDFIDALEGWVQRYQTAPTAVLRTRVVTGVLAAAVLAAVVLTFAGRLGWAFGVAGMVVQAAVAHFAITGFARRTYLFTRLRQAAARLSVGDWLLLAAGGGLFAVLLWLLQLLWVWIGFGLIGVGLAAARRIALDRPVEAEREPAVAGCRRLLNKLARSGQCEEQARLFVAKYGGRQWEEFYEELFGYEAKVKARAVLGRGESAGPRDTFAGWRDPIVQTLDRFEQRRKAEEVLAWDLPSSPSRSPSSSTRLDDVMATARSGTLAKQTPRPQQTARLERPVPVQPVGWVGTVARVLLGGLLLAACVGWAIQNRIWVIDGHPMAALVIPGIPSDLTAWCDTANVGWAGALLLASASRRGFHTTTLVLAGAAVTLFAHKLGGTPPVEPVRDYHVAALLGSAIALVGYRLGRR